MTAQLPTLAKLGELARDAAESGDPHAPALEAAMMRATEVIDQATEAELEVHAGEQAGASKAAWRARR